MQTTQQTFELFLNGMFSLMWILVNFYIVAVELRFLVSWFLNINPYFEPLLSLWLWTNPVFCFGRSFYPKILSFDPAPIINFQILYFLQAKLGKYVKNLNNGAPPTPGMDSGTNPDPESGTNPELFSTPEWVYDIRHWIQNLLFKVKDLINSSSDSDTKIESSRNFFETIIFYLKKIINVFLDNFIASFDEPDETTLIYMASGEQSTKDHLSSLIFIDEDNTVDLVSNVDTHAFAEQFFTPLSQTDILDHLHNYSIELDFSTLIDKDFLSQLNYCIVDNFLM